jgi:hypothetical protein
MIAGFQGLLERVEVPDLLTFIHLGRRTGVLDLEHDGKTTRTFFRDGQPVFATSNKEGLRLGDVLVRMGRLTRKDVDRCLARPRAGGDRLGLAMVAEGALKEEELTPILKVQVSEVLFDTFTWKAGTFAFYDDLAPPPGMVTLEMDVQNLLMEGMRRLDERGRLSEVFSDMDAVLESVANPERIKGNVTMTPEEWRIFFTVDGRRTVREVCQLAGNPDELATLEILNRLMGGNLIGFATPTAPAEAPPEPAPTPTFVKPGMKAVVPPAPPSGPGLPPAPPEVRTGTDVHAILNPDAVQYLGARMSLSARLVLRQKGGTVPFPLSRETHSLGRGPKNDIVLQDGKVSVFHARIDRSAEGWRIVDLESTNGTFVDGKRVTAAVLRPGAVVTLGDLPLDYVED